MEDFAYPILSRLLYRLWDRRVRLRMVHVKLSNVSSGVAWAIGPTVLNAPASLRPKCDEVASCVKGQLDLFGVKERQRKLAVTCEEIRHKFGPKGLMRAHDWKLETARA